MDIQRCKGLHTLDFSRVEHIITCMVLLSDTCMHAQLLIYLQLAGRWPIKRLIAVWRVQAIRPPSDPEMMAHAWGGMGVTSQM